MIDKFKIRELCFGTYIEINDFDIFDVTQFPSEHNSFLELDKKTKDLKRETLELLIKNVDNLTQTDWEKIIGIISYHEEFDTEYDSGTACDCCGTYDETTTHTRDLNAHIS